MALKHFSDEHPLIYYKVSGYGMQCDGCNERTEGGIFRCRECDFVLHKSCAELPQVLQHPIHLKFMTTKLTLFRRSIIYTCDVCGKEGKRMPYQCDVCAYWVDPKCTSFLRTVRHIRHERPLNLINSLNIDHFENPFCEICAKKVDINYKLYHCSKCDFVCPP
ncbi:hypothetical protein SO802_031774 [Lithocarpus litseifolius]|uniref:DC1 domain-containing protein n=1 Tax=Lithocarpus litseifolius TaxID=425828 RepID=A0AAW2BN73_9ROSI